MTHSPLRLLAKTLAALLLPALLTGCKPGVPDGILKEGAMEDALYDYHLAQAMAEEAAGDSVSYYAALYRQAALRKHGLSQAVFDRSMEWYMRHTDKLSKIYTRLSARYGNTSASAVPVSGGDTLEIGRLPLFALLNAQGENRLSFEERPDTTLRRGDEVQWSFSAAWYYHDGLRAASAVLVLRYEGDSVAVTQQEILSDGRQTVSMRVNTDRRVLSVSGFVYQKSAWSERPRLLTLSFMRLMRVRRKDLPPAPSVFDGDGSQDGGAANADGSAADSPQRPPRTPQQRLRDSLLRADTLNERRNHFR